METAPIKDDTENVVALFSAGRRPNGGGGGPRNQHGLTAREEAFARHVSQGQTHSEAYRRAYNATKMKPNSVWRAAYETASRPLVKVRIDGLVGAMERDAMRDGERTRAFIAERLWAEASDMSNRTSDRLRAVELLGKLSHVGAFVERSEVVKTELSAEVIEQRIQELLSRALARAGPHQRQNRPEE